MSDPSAGGGSSAGTVPRRVGALIVGGGPAGATTAWMLARAGIETLVVERATFPRDKPCSEFLSPQASRLLEEMGVLDGIERAGAARLAGMLVRAPDGACLTGRYRAGHGWRGWRDVGLAIRRRVLDTMLLQAAGAAGARVVQGARVIDVTRTGAGRVSGVRLHLPDEPPVEIEAGVVVGADGLRSIVSRRLGLARRRGWPRRIALVSHYRGVAGMGELGEMTVDREGYSGLADVGGGETNVAVVIPAARAAALAGDATGFFERWIAARPALAARFRDAERSTPVVACGPFASRARRAWAPGAALVGDAADFFDPFTGEGIYAALRGGELLAPYLVEALRAPHARAADVALAAYDRCRRREFAGKWRVEWLVALAVSSPWLMNRVTRALAARPDLADLFVGVAGDFVPAREVLRPSYLLRLLLPALHTPLPVNGPTPVPPPAPSPPWSTPTPSAACSVDSRPA